jgi:3-dehydroquinate dehydratase I
MPRRRLAQAVDESSITTQFGPMKHMQSWTATGSPKVVGSFGSSQDLRETAVDAVQAACDMAEIRLDLLTRDDASPAAAWSHLKGEIPLLFTARRGDEGGSGALPAAARIRLLEAALDDASCVDIEVASIAEMAPVLEILAGRNIPWIASFHDFEKLPETAVLEAAAARAQAAGALVFKVAVMLRSPADLARLAGFQLAPHGLPAATMGMGPLAPVSRLLCAQCGSLLNYGFLGQTTTAPGQWSAATLRRNIARLTPFPG